MDQAAELHVTLRSDGPTFLEHLMSACTRLGSSVMVRSRRQTAGVQQRCLELPCAYRHVKHSSRHCWDPVIVFALIGHVKHSSRHCWDPVSVFALIESSPAAVFVFVPDFCCMSSEGVKMSSLAPKEDATGHLGAHAQVTSLPAPSGVLKLESLDHKLLAGSSSRGVLLLQQQLGSTPTGLGQLQALQLVQRVG